MMKSFYPVVFVIALASSAMVSPSSPLACEQRPEQNAFRWELAEDALPQPNGMLLIEYEDPTDHLVTHVTYHRIIQLLPRPVFTTVALKSDQMSVEVDGSLGPLLYVIVAAPLYYGTDIDESGLPQRLWIDPEEDGLNGNEQLVFSR
jgi:hypothetical protein